MTIKPLTLGERDLLRAIVATGQPRVMPYRDGRKPWRIERGGRGWKWTTFHKLADCGYLTIENEFAGGIRIVLTEAGRAAAGINPEPADTDVATVGRSAAANRVYDGSYTDLEAILHDWDVMILDAGEEYGGAMLAPIDLAKAGLLDALENWKNAAVQAALTALNLHDEFGILDHGGGEREAKTEPIPLRTWNAALCVELRAKGIFDPGSRRPATLMRRKATDWAEIPADVAPDDIMPSYSNQKAAREANV